jgi:hypothetical protein
LIQPDQQGEKGNGPKGGAEKFEGQRILQPAQALLQIASAPDGNLGQKHGPHIRWHPPEQQGRRDRPQAPAEQLFHQRHGARIAPAQHQQKQEGFQGKNRQTQELDPQEGLRAWVHRCQVLRVRRWVTSL